MYIPFYLKTENSLLTSMIRIPELVAYAKNHGLTCLSICDNNLYGAMEFIKECKSHHVKPIIGLEVSIEERAILLYAMHHKGYQNLIHLSTKMSEQPLTFFDLSEYADDLICMVPFLSKEQYESCKNIYQIVYQGYEDELQKQELSGEHLIFLRPILCLTEEEQQYLPYLYSIKDGRDIVMGEGMYSLESMLDTAYLDSYQSIYNLCQFQLEKEPDLLPIYDCPNDMTSEQYVKQLCQEGMRRRFGNTVSRIYIERIKYELSVIEKMGFSNYFLVVWDYVNYAKQHDILVGPGRGSAAGSLVSYCLGITDVDPIQYQLLFERFLNPDRITMPDIDIDFAYDKREEIIQYCIQKYGIKRVAGIITFGTLGTKQVIRDVCRCFGIPLPQVDRLCKQINVKLNLKENYQKNDKIQKLLETDETIRQAYKVAGKLEGLKRHTSIHAAGIIMCNRDLDEVVPLEKHGNWYLTGYSMEYLEEFGLLKMDFLALKTLSTIDAMLKEINQKGESLSFEKIPISDPDAIYVFTSANTMGIFQFEKPGMMEFLRKLKASSFEDIFAALALYRPGPMDNIDSYIRRKQGKETIDYFHEDLMPILKPTYGILIYQEQIMQVASTMAGYSYAEADVLRRAMSKKKEEVLRQEKEKFVSGAIARGYDDEVSEKVYQLIFKFASYGFNRSHSVAYAIIAYKMAYLKAHYPSIFMKSLLTSAIGASMDTKDYIYECKCNHISILLPDINESELGYCIQNDSIRYPFANIKNVGVVVAKSILESRQDGKFKNIYDFVKRTNRKVVNKKIFLNLIGAGCFDSFGINRHTLTEHIDILLNYGELAKDLDEEYVLKPELELLEEYTKKELMQKELEVFGFYLSNHPVTEYRVLKNGISLSSIPDYFDRTVQIIVMIESMKEIATKKGDTMCFVTGSDEVTSVEIVLFPITYQKYSNLEVGQVIEIFGKVEKRFDQYQIIVNQIHVMGEINKN